MSFLSKITADNNVSINYAAIGVINESYISKPIREMDQSKVIPVDLNGKSKTLLFLEGKAFIPDREFEGPDGGKIKNLIGMRIHALEERKMVVENINRGDLSLFIADFYIVYESSPSNILFASYHRLMHFFGSTMLVMAVPISELIMVEL